MGLRAGIGVASVLVLWSCATSRAIESTASMPPPATVRAPAPVEAPDDGRVEISGQLRAHDGEALRMAEVVIRRRDFREPEATAALDDAGRFRVEVPPGAYHVVIAAVDHRQVWRTTLVTEDLRVAGRLGTYDRAEPGDELSIRGELLDAAGTIVGRGPSTAARVADHVYRLELSGKPEGVVALRYQLVPPSGGATYNGPVADRYESDGGGDFWSIVDVSTKDAVELDLRALPEPGKAPQLQWTGETPAAAALHEFEDRWNAAVDDVIRRSPRKDGRLVAMTEELRAEAKALATRALAEVEAAADPTTQALLRTANLSIFGAVLGTESDPAALRTEVDWIIEHLPPTDPHVPLLRDLDRFVFRARKDADAAFLARTDAWLERRAREHAEPAAALEALELLLDAADARRDDARVAALYPLVQQERFAGTFVQTRLRQRFDPDRILQRGKPLPGFDFAALRDDGVRITSADRQGRVYLLEFWATWCAPCIAEMPKLHATYAAINGAKPGKGGGERGLRRLAPAKRPQVEFVFVSLDTDPETVDVFREQHWSMPWTHGFVGKSGEADVMARYGFSGVPTAVLVDETGTILEVGGALRKDALLPTLERAVAERGGDDRRASDNGAPGLRPH